MRFTVLAVAFILAANSHTFAQEAAPSAGQMVDVDIQIVQWTAKDDRADSEPDLTKINVAALEKTGELEVLQRIRLSALDQQKAFVQLGERRAVVSSINQLGGGRPPQRNFEYHNLGTMVSAAPRIDGDRVIVELKVERTGLQSPPAGDAKEMDAPTPATYNTLMVQTVASAKSGDSVVVGASTTAADSGRSATVVIFTATWK